MPPLSWPTDIPDLLRRTSIVYNHMSVTQRTASHSIALHTASTERSDRLIGSTARSTRPWPLSTSMQLAGDEQPLIRLGPHLDSGCAQSICLGHCRVLAWSIWIQQLEGVNPRLLGGGRPSEPRNVPCDTLATKTFSGEHQKLRACSFVPPKDGMVLANGRRG